MAPPTSQSRQRQRSQTSHEASYASANEAVTPAPPTDVETSLEKHSCSGKPIVMYDSCDSQLQTGKLLKGKGHSFQNVKGLVSIAVPEGCSNSHTEAIRGEALHADNQPCAIIKGSKRVCVKSILNKPVVLVGMEDDGDLVKLSGHCAQRFKERKNWNRNCAAWSNQSQQMFGDFESIACICFMCINCFL